MVKEEVKKVLIFHDRVLKQMLRILEQTKYTRLPISFDLAKLEDIFLSNESKEVENILYPQLSERKGE